jgi:hypothetical protein
MLFMLSGGTCYILYTPIVPLSLFSIFDLHRKKKKKKN